MNVIELIYELAANDVDPLAEVSIRVNDGGHGFDLAGCDIDYIRTARRDPDNGDMETPVEIVVVTP